MKGSKYLLLICCFNLLASILEAQEKDTRVREYIYPKRIVWQYDGNGKLIKNIDFLLNENIAPGQCTLFSGDMCIMKSIGNEYPAILIDFGKEIHGSLKIVSAQKEGMNPTHIRVRFGESVSEAMSTVGQKGATNDHAMRDFTIRVPSLGTIETTSSGFRFVRIDLLDIDCVFPIKEILAVHTYRDIPYRGTFECDDDRLNTIWQTGAYTVHLNMQEYLWDGIKRDRLVWVGDLHPEIKTIGCVFGYNDVVPKSLDLSRDTTPLPGWMNGISSYSLWWILIHYDWYMLQGDRAYLEEQKMYLCTLLRHLFSKISSNGKEQLDGQRFLDWPSNNNKEGVDAGLQALMIMALDAGSKLCEILEESELAIQCIDKIDLLKSFHSDVNGSKQAAALQVLAGIANPQEMVNRIIFLDGASDFSTFYGYYMLQAMALAGEYTKAIDVVKTYWGGMIDLGATTFWEHFDLDWTKDAALITEIVPEGKRDVHGDFGDYCYRGFRNSLCHGWASGPTAWLSEHILGVKIIEPGCRRLKIEPHLASLNWVKGTFPTPLGEVYIEHKMVNGKIRSLIKAPKGVRIDLIN